MSGVEETLSLLAKSIAVLNGVIELSGNAAHYREVVSKAIAEGRDFSDAELAEFKDKAESAIAELKSID